MFHKKKQVIFVIEYKILQNLPNAWLFLDKELPW